MVCGEFEPKEFHLVSGLKFVESDQAEWRPSTSRTDLGKVLVKEILSTGRIADAPRAEPSTSEPDAHVVTTRDRRG
jgi:hypothetical protein